MSQPPTTIGRYQVFNRIGRGGMGFLYLAWDPMLERQIAIKLLREDMDELRERFGREARSVARLRHPNIVTIFDVGEQDGQPFIAMEYIHGQTLADIIRSEPQLNVSRKLKIVDQLCDGLAFAHKMSIIHRDVKPANVMVEHDGSVKILDFGIARIAESGMTMAGMLIGTLNYMSPEQVTGQVADRRSDIFAVGAVMYELLSRQQAFPGGLHNGILNRIMHEHPPSLETLVPSLPKEVIEVVSKALEKDPQARYQDLTAMRRDLQKVWQDLDLGADDPPVRESGNNDETVAVETPAVSGRRTPRAQRGSQREALARMRATQIAAHLAVARRAFEAGDFEAAISAGEQALLLDADDQGSADLVDRARAALDERQARELVGRGEELLRAGSITEAFSVADEALKIAPSFAAAVRLRDSAERQRSERDNERARLDAVREATARAHAALQRAAHEEAIAAAAEALLRAPGDEAALTIQRRAREAIDQAEQVALERHARRTADHARRLFDEGRHAEALATLTGFAREHPHVTETLEHLRQEKVRLEREAERARQQRIAEAIVQANASDSHEAALGYLREAATLDPARADIAGLIVRRQAAWDQEREEARLARERGQKIADGLARASAATSHEAAIAILEALLPIGPDNAAIREMLAARKAAVEGERRSRFEALAQRTAAQARRLFEGGKHDEAFATLAGFAGEHPEIAETLEQLRQEQARLAREAERVRQERIAAAIAQAKATPSHEAALGYLRDAATLDSGRADIAELIAGRQAALEQEREEARRAREREQQIAEGLSRARAAASHPAAIAILEGLLPIAPEHDDVSRMLAERKSALAREQEEQRQVAQRQQQIAELLARAERSQDHEAAIALLTGALALDSARADVSKALQARKGALERERKEQRRTREREQKIAIAIEKAYASRSHEEALTILKAALTLDPAHAELQALVQSRQVSHDQEREDARRERERQARIAAAIAHASATPSHVAAIGILEEALHVDPSHPDLMRLLAERRAALEQQKQQERERRQRIATAMAKAIDTPSHADAVATLRQVASLEPEHTELRALLAAREAALTREHEEERRERERQERIAAAIAQAKDAASSEAAVAILQSARAIASDHEELRQLLATAQANLAREQEQAARLRERQDRVAALLKQAKGTSSHESAVAILGEILTLDPQHGESQRLLARSQAALDHERAEAKRLRDIEAARQSVVDLIAAGDFAAAEGALAQAEQTLGAKKLFKAERRQLKQARAGTSSSKSRKPITLGPRLVAALATAAVIVLALGYFVLRPTPDPATLPHGTTTPEPSTRDASGSPQSVPVPQPDRRQPPPPSDTAAPAGTGPAVATSPTTTPPSVDPRTEPPPASDPAAAVAATTVETARLAREELKQGQLPRAIGTIAKGLRLDPRNPELRSLARTVLSSARQAAATARARAAEYGESATSTTAYRDGQARTAEAARRERAGQQEQAVRLLGEATALFGEAHRVAITARTTQPPPTGTVTPEPVAPPPSPLPPARVEPNPVPPVAAPTPKPTVTNPVSPPAPTPAPQTSAASEEDAIKATLREYAAAYKSLNVDAVRRVYPTVNAAALTRSFRDLTAQDVEVSNEQIAIDETNAVVRCQVRQAFTPRVGQGRSQVVNSEFRLQKTGGRWVIVARR